MEITAENYGHAVILNIRGELTEDNLAAFRKTVDRHLEGKSIIDLVLNLENVPFMDSAAFECLLEMQDRLAERLGQVKLLKPDENIKKILEITRLESSFEVYRDVPEAVRAIHA